MKVFGVIFIILGIFGFIVCEYKAECNQKSELLANCNNKPRPRYSYNYETNLCEKFNDGACRSSSNNFIDADTCEKACVQLPTCKEAPNVSDETCNESIERWSYHSDIKRCVKFNYRGCGGNKNNFQTLKDCERSCDLNRKCRDLDPRKESTNCSANKQLRYTYNIDTKECLQFSIGGCGSSENNFKYLDECQHYCVPGFKGIPQSWLR